MKQNRLIAAVLALSCAFSAAAFAAEETETPTTPNAAAEATADPSTTETEDEQATDTASETPTETATEDAAEAASTPTPTIDVNAPKLYERPAFIPAPTAEPTQAPVSTEEAVPTETASAEPSETAAAVSTEVPEENTDNEPSMQTAENPSAAPTEAASEAPAEQASEAADEQSTEAPSETATSAPTATPTAAPTAAPTATPLPAKQSVNLKSLLGTVSLDSKYTDTYYSDVKAVIMDISVSGYTYGNEYDAAYKSTALTERQFKNLTAGYVDETLSELKAAASGSTFYSILADITVRISPAAAITTIPVFEKKSVDSDAATEWYYFPEYIKTTSITAPTAVPTAEPTATPKPSSGTNTASGSSSTRQSSGNSSQIAAGVNICGSAASNGSSYSAGGFTDLGSVPWAQTAITALSAMGILNGRSDTVFDPNADITRAEFAKLVCTALNISGSGSGKEFSDVSSSDWFHPYVRAAAGCGIVNGVSDTVFDPNAVIRREDMAAMLYRAIKISGKTIPAGTAKGFADEGSISDYARESVSALSAAGIINGVSDTEFSPSATATRAQSAAIIYQYFTAVGIK